MKQQGLFRQQVLEHKRKQYLETVLLDIPTQFHVCTWIICLCMLSLLIFIFCAPFSEKHLVQGYLESSLGLVRVFAPRVGVLSRCYVHQGDTVMRGDKLFLVDTLYEGLKHKGQHHILDTLQQKYRFIESRIDVKKQQLRSITPLWTKHYISSLEYQRYKNELDTLIQQKHAVHLEIGQYRLQAAYFIRSPVEGVVVSIPMQEGQYTQHMHQPLLKIMPKKANLVAELLVPVSLVGFLQKKDSVLIHYDAYPYQRFGAAHAKIMALSHSILTDAEEEKPIRMNKPYYRVRAKLDQQNIAAYGKTFALQQGMTFSAVTVGAKKKIWRWIFEPLLDF